MSSVLSDGPCTRLAHCGQPQVVAPGSRLHFANISIEPRHIAHCSAYHDSRLRSHYQLGPINRLPP